MLRVETAIVGAGVSGLACAIALRRRGRSALVLEAGQRIGGRVRTDQVDGFLLDYGFQVVNVAAPALGRYVPTRALRLRRLPRTVWVRWGGRWERFGLDARSVGASFAGPRDLAALAAAAAQVLPSNRAALAGDDESAERWLRRRGLSPSLVDAFFRPFFGGVLLDPALSSSAKCLRFDLRQFLTGPTALPARGLRAVPEVMAEQLPQGAVRVGARVADLLRGDDGRVLGVRLDSQEEVLADHVVLATEPPETARLTGLDLPVAGRGEVCVYAAVDRPLFGDGRLRLDATGTFANALELSATASSYAPSGRALVALVAPGRWDGRDEVWSDAARETLAGWFPALPAGAVQILRVERIPYATLDQPPGVHARLQGSVAPVPGLHLAGEVGLAGSVNGALLSGERAARRIVRQAGH